jgi:hypothetical protein
MTGTLRRPHAARFGRGTPQENLVEEGRHDRGAHVGLVMHVRHAVEMSEEFRASAKADFDLDAIRDEPAFKQLINN